MTVHFRGSKADQRGHGAERTLQRSGSRWLCPVIAMWQLSELGYTSNIPDSELLCSSAPKKAVLASEMIAAVKSSGQALGMDPSDFGTHSLRSGGATAMFRARVDRLVIKMFGRCSSNAFEIYTRMDNQVTRHLAQVVVSV